MLGDAFLQGGPGQGQHGHPLAPDPPRDPGVSTQKCALAAPQR